MIQRSNGGAVASPRISQEDLATVAPMRSPRREAQVGIFVLIGIVSLVAVMFSVTDPGTFRNRYYVSTQVADAGGIRRGDPVQLRGVNIGRVRSFEMQENGVRIRMELEHEYDVPADSRVSLRSNGLLGGVVATFIPGTSREVLEEGDVVESAGAPTGLMESAADLAPKADTVLVRAQELLNRQTIASVGASASELQALLTELSALAGEQRRELAGLSASLRRSAAGVEASATRPELARAIARTDSITLRLDVATQQLNAASVSLASVIGRIDRGEGTLGKLSRDDELYENLNAAAQNLNALATDIRQNPRRYINVSVF
jgi:phospholipid/cholesterol/gamma-HCH transport system substrate-binding protein